MTVVLGVSLFIDTLTPSPSRDASRRFRGWEGKTLLLSCAKFANRLCREIFHDGQISDTGLWGQPWNNYQLLKPVNRDDWAILPECDGRPRGKSWRPVAMRHVRTSDRGGVRKPSDFPHCECDSLVMNVRAMGILNNRMWRSTASFAAQNRRGLVFRQRDASHRCS